MGTDVFKLVKISISQRINIANSYYLMHDYDNDRSSFWRNYSHHARLIIMRSSRECTCITTAGIGDWPPAHPRDCRGGTRRRSYLDLAARSWLDHGSIKRRRLTWTPMINREIPFGSLNDNQRSVDRLVVGYGGHCAGVMNLRYVDRSVDCGQWCDKIVIRN